MEILGTNCLKIYELKLNIGYEVYGNAFSTSQLSDKIGVFSHLNVLTLITRNLTEKISIESIENSKVRK